MHDLNDTIVALSSAPGAGGRAIIRLSGPDAIRITTRIFTSSQPVQPHARRLYQGELLLPDLSASLPADLYIWPPPRTYTGQQLAELHVLSSPPLVEQAIAELLQGGARAARRGEFTQRAFLAGKLDLTRAEAVLAVIEAGTRDELKQALTQLAGGVTRPLQQLRSDLLDLLADIEAALDFADEDIHFVEQTVLLKRLAHGMALVTILQKQMDQRAVGGRLFRVVLIGPPNVGKSSLLNALARRHAALVSPKAGTTRDYLTARILVEGVEVELVDTAGHQSARNGIEHDAQRMTQEQLADADLLIACHEAGTAWSKTPIATGTIPLLDVATKCDRAEPLVGQLATSATTGQGIDALRRLLAERARRLAVPALAPSLSRCRHHVQRCLEHLRRAHALVLDEQPPELLALEVRSALDEMGEMVGAVYTDDLLDRIFSRFCIGK